MPEKIIICGNREFTDYVLLKKEATKLIVELKMAGPITIVSGECRGADKLGEKFAIEYKFGIDRHPAKWDDIDAEPCIIKRHSDGSAFNVLAGTNRNREMAEKSTHCLAFWDGTPGGTKDMIGLAKSHGLHLRVIRTDKLAQT